MSRQFVTKRIFLHSLHTKCNRVRSWYLYEQYKALEKNQLDAANRLKNRTYQERILKQELYERRARRSLCDQFDEIRSDTALENIYNIRRTASLSCVSDDDFFESFNELHEEYELDPEHGHTFDSNTSKNCEFNQCMENNNSHLTNFAGDVPNDLYSTDVKEKLDFANKNVPENMNFQLNPVKENIEHLGKRAKLDGSEKVTDSESFYEFCNCNSKVLSRDLKDKLGGSTENCVLFVWSKLVAFAYNIIQLNHDNCYYDCSSQFLIGILMCDALRRGISSMCYILQPYVSPIKYAVSDTYILMENKEDKSRKNNKYLKTTNGTKINKFKRNKSPKKLYPLGRKYHSEIKWQNRSKHSSDNYYPSKIKYHGASEPWCSTNKLCEKERSCKLYNEWPDTFVKCGIFDENKCQRRCVKRVVDPILQMARYIDSILQDIDEIKNL
uniref:HM00049 protein n=1 Tax=Heliconius melpomene TaxID=34740 RepID=D0AB97_HELME|nr:HM00049 [Heliconius melpomene]